MILDLQEVARIVRARAEPPPAKVTGWSVDTRTQNMGDLYFALPGPNRDGHDFVAAALEKGAVAAVVQRNGLTVPFGSLLRVSDSLRALQELAGWARVRWGGTVIGVTGSAGKTTTKDAIAHLLSTRLPTGRTVGNFNNHVGVPLSILRLDCASRAAVIEIGMNHAGEIRELAAIARPQVGVVTNVGYAHVEFFESIEGVAAAKRELIEALPRDGTAVLNADDERVLRFGEIHSGRTITFGLSEHAQVRAEAVEYAGAGARFRALGVDYETGLTGRHAVLNLLAAIAVARAFDIPPESLREAVRTFSAGKMRGERLEHRGIVVWNDCYNSNPEAAMAMIDVLRDTAASRRIAVLGEMLELGHAAVELHRKVGTYAAAHGVDVVIGIRGSARAILDGAVAAGLPPSAAYFFDDPAEAGEFVRRTARASDAILFKGSRGVHVERALERFLA